MNTLRRKIFQILYLEDSRETGKRARGKEEGAGVR